MPSSNFKFLSHGVAAATQNRHLPFTAARLLSGPEAVPIVGCSPAAGEFPDIEPACALVWPAPPVAKLRAAAAPIDSKKLRRVVRIVLSSWIRGNLPQL